MFALLLLIPLILLLLMVWAVGHSSRGQKK
jgi:hypothetical protein